MGKALKDANRVPLLVAMVANLAAYYAAMTSDAILGGEWMELVRSWGRGTPAALGIIAIGIINAQIGSLAKARLVFLRWRDPLPGSRAFSQHAHSDPRVNIDALKRRVRPWPTGAKQQNSTWFKLFKSVENHPSVAQVHREYLFARDYAFLAVVLILTLGPAAFFQFPDTRTAAIYLAVLILQFLLTTRAARVHGDRFVTTVLALKGAGK